MPYTAKRYQTENGEVPYTDWMKKLRRKDQTAALKVDSRIARAMGGNFGDHKFERDGVWELRVDYGPGYRVYYSIEDGEIILLLIGGNKKTQTADLDKAVSYLQDFKKEVKKMTATKNVKSQKNDYPASVDHNAAMIEELRADPDYANAYLANALEEINEPGGLGGFLVALRQVIEARGGISEAARKSGLARQSIYRALSPNGNPTITTLAQLTSVAGLQFTLSKSSH